MMMNFKKNQNNAVCSMDCKNCPHGASQPNPMDDPMFEKSIAMLHNWLCWRQSVKITRRSAL